MRAAVYLRISRDKTGEGLGVERQSEDCLELAKALGWEVVEVYTDNDISATSGKPRPAYRKMLADMDAGKVNAIIAWHPDRLYRRAVDLGDLVDACKRNATQVATVNAGHVDLTTPTGRLVAGLLANVAIYEGEHKAERWMRSWQQGREKGKFPGSGSRLFGYTRAGEVVPDEKAIARRMVSDIAGGVPLLYLTSKLEAAGVQTTRGTVWRTAAVRQYLKNPMIAGYSTHKGEVVAEGQWEPLVDRDTWETVRALLDSRVRGTFPRVSVLTGLIYCGKCGHRLITGKARYGRTYRCPNRPGMRGCGGTSAGADNIEEVVEAYARQRLSDPETLARAQELQSAGGASELLTEIAALEARVLELNAELDSPGVPVATILRAITRAQTRLGECQRELADAVERSIPLPNAGGMDWPEGLAERRRLIVAALAGKKVYLDPLPATAMRAWHPERVRIG